MRLLFTNPDAFFSERTDSSGLVPPIAVVIITALLGAISGIPALQAIMTAVPERTASPIVYLISMASTFALILFFWVGFAVAFHAISFAFESEGRFLDTLVLVGWGYVPSAAYYVLATGINYYVFSNTTFPNDPTAISSFVRDLQNKPILIALGLLGIVFTLYRGYLWVFAVKHARNVNLREAAIIVGIPVGLKVLWDLYNVLPI